MAGQRSKRSNGLFPLLGMGLLMVALAGDTVKASQPAFSPYQGTVKGTESGRYQGEFKLPSGVSVYTGEYTTPQQAQQVLDIAVQQASNWEWQQGLFANHTQITQAEGEAMMREAEERFYNYEF